MYYVQKYLERLSPEKQEFIRVPISNKILLYYNFYSFYSQKVLMALYEKGVEFEPIVVDITKGEQYSSWFLELNARGEVPVLQNGSQIVPDSARILDYLEKYVDKGAHPLINVSKDTTVVKKIIKFRELIDALPVGVVTMGSFFHQELCAKPKLPFIPPVREMFKSAELNSAQNLRKLAEENPKAKPTLLYKADIQDRKHDMLTNKEEYLKVLGKVEELLTEVEKELETRDPEHWLCCENFTIADINLTILLQRLYELGFEDRFWTNGKRPLVERYYSRVQERKSFKASIPNLSFHLKIIIASQPPAVLGLFSVASLGALLGMVYVVKKIVR